MNGSFFGLGRKVWWMVAAGAALPVMVAALSGAFRPVRLPYHDSFSRNSGSGWHAYGGAWQVRRHVARNESDERGAKMVAGNPRWRDYTLEGDTRLLSHGGDVGFVVRVNNESTGVDAYDGYYVGVRTGDNSLVIGRSSYGWMEGDPAPVAGGVRALEWYHLRIVAVGCAVAASARDTRTGVITYAALRENPCVRDGKIGLRSHATGGEWRNISVVRARPSDLRQMLDHVAKVTRPLYPRDEAGYNATHTFPTFDHSQDEAGSGWRNEVAGLPIASLASLKLARLERARVRGVVTLTSPSLYIQDATGGAVILPAKPPLLNLGDEIEAVGSALPQGYSTAIQNAEVRRMWDRTPYPPMLVTPSQAATGAYDAMLIETEGTLEGTEYKNDRLILTLQNGEESFQAIAQTAKSGYPYSGFALHSRLRLRGICVLDASATRGLTPFALWLRSADDVERLAGPPWWNKKHMTELGFALLLLALAAQLIYSSVEKWQLHAVAHERERLAYELHDTLAQSFAGIGYQLQGIRNRVRAQASSGLEALVNPLEAVCENVRKAHEEASLSIAMLRDFSPESSDLAGALERCTSQMCYGGTMTVQVISSGEVRPVSLPAADALFHIGREAIANALRHAGATQIRVALNYSSDLVILTIEDDGGGFEAQRPGNGLGLRGMEKRAKDVHAELAIESQPGKGTRVTVQAPVAVKRDYVAYFAWFGRSLRKIRSGWQRA